MYVLNSSESFVKLYLGLINETEAEERVVDHVPLAPFLGNRFNVLFYNAGTYFLEDHLKVFFLRELKIKINYCQLFIMI